MSQWCHPTISSSVIPFTSCLQSFPASGSFQMSQFFTSGIKVLEFQLQHQSFQPVHSEGDQSWDFFGRNDAKAETPVLWPPHAKIWLIGKDSDAGRDWGQEEKGTPEDEMAGWQHWLDELEPEWTPGVCDGPGGLACWDSWGHKEWDTTERLNWTDTYNGMLFSLKEEGSPVLCDNRDEFWGHYTKWNKLVIEGQVLHDSTYMRYLK